MLLPEGSAASLRAVIAHNCDAIMGQDERLKSVKPAFPQAEYRDLAAAAYCLHNIYNALENSFEQISRTFENHVVDVTHWHKELLEKMFLDMSPVRPRIFPRELRQVLNDLRGFRHLFRHAYDFQLDSRRMEVLLKDWQQYREQILDCLRVFTSSLNG
jgi:hypothetical protein